MSPGGHGLAVVGAGGGGDVLDAVVAGVGDDRSPAASMVMAAGSLSFADPAGPPSPVEPEAPVALPAMV